MRSGLQTFVPTKQVRAPDRQLFRSRRGFNLIEVTLAVALFTIATLLFAALYPTASRASRLTGSYSQGISILQHKVDQLRAVGYGSLDYTNLVNTGLIDAAPSTGAYHFETIDALSQELWSPVGTITISDVTTEMKRADISLSWTDGPGSPARRSHVVSILIGRAQ